MTEITIVVSPAFDRRGKADMGASMSAFRAALK